MAIVIKEIQVKTVIERSATSSDMDETLIRRIQDEIYQRIKDEQERDYKKRKER